MMYLFRWAVVSLGVFFLVYAGLSSLVAVAWRTIRTPPSATFLYMLRVLPLVGTGGVVLLVAMPSFFYLEPREATETMGVGGMVLALGGVAVIANGIVSAVAASRRAARFVRSHTVSSRRLNTNAGLPAFEMSCVAPALLVSGVCRPRLLISGRASELLEPSEMEVAIRHELAHVQRRDNLKKMVLRSCAFPFLASLDRAWLQAAEVAADDAAVHNERAALDLASALIKIARESQEALAPELAMSLVPVPGAGVSARVSLLLAWQRPTISRNSYRRELVLLFALAALSLAANYTWILAQMHELTELLVR